MSSFLERLNQMRIELAQRDADPLRDKVEATVRGLEAISSATLLDTLHDPSANSEIGPPQRNPFRRRRASTKGD